VREWAGIHSTLLNGLNVVRPQVWNVILTALLTLGLDLVLVRRLGPLGLAVGGFLAFAMTAAWYFPYLARRALQANPSIDLLNRSIS
jgi:Na+-driven multidrug efflux pump